MPRITVRYFAILREQKGRDEEAVDVPEGATVEQVYHQLFPAVDGQRLPVGYARNRAMARPGEVVEEGDELGLLPPLGGG